MKTTRIHTLILLVLTGLILYQSFTNGGTVRQAKELTHSLEIQLDSLQVIYESYQRIHETYVGVLKRRWQQNIIS